MNYLVLVPLKVKTPEGIREVQTGKVVSMSEDLALRLIQGGKVKLLPMPYFGPDGDVVIPFVTDSRYQWWKGGQSVEKTIEEIRAL
jgi:hypothetical protein